jgi:methylmalonyl-CoA/ethylmalonyl-CoA epimerase
MISLQFSHIGIATDNIAATSSFYFRHGYIASDVVLDPVQNVNICFLRKDGQPEIELLAPVDDKSPVNRIIAVNGVTPYHICYAVKDIDCAIKDLKLEKFIVVSKPVPACAMNNERVSFLFNKDVGLIELVEKK